MTRPRIVAAAAIWLILTALLIVSQAEPDIFVLGAIIALLAATASVTVDLLRAVLLVHWPQTQAHTLSRTSGNERTEKLRTRAYSAARTGSKALHQSLVDLLDDRLLSKHQIDRAADPEAAMELLTPSLRQLVAGPQRRLGQVHILDQILTDIEDL